MSVRSNLYHLLLNWSWFEIGQAPPWTSAIPERDGGLDDWPPSDRERWQAALDTFNRLVPGRNEVFDEGLIAVRGHIAGAVDIESVPAADRPLVEAVDSVTPLYHKHWWPAHRDENRRWRDALVPSLRKAEAMMTERLARAYGGAWPTERVPIDVVVHAVPVGAYSTGGRVTMSSTRHGLEMPHALEMVLHEASHLGPLEPALRDALEEAFRDEGREAPDRLWHDLIFYTSAEITRIAFAEILTPGAAAYCHYGEATGLYERGKDRWEPMRPVLDATWRPFIASGSNDPDERRTALRAFVKQLRP